MKDGTPKHDATQKREGVDPAALIYRSTDKSALWEVQASFASTFISPYRTVGGQWMAASEPFESSSPKCCFINSPR